MSAGFSENFRAAEFVVTVGHVFTVIVSFPGIVMSVCDVSEDVPTR